MLDDELGCDVLRDEFPLMGGVDVLGDIMGNGGINSFLILFDEFLEPVFRLGKFLCRNDQNLFLNAQRFAISY